MNRVAVVPRWSLKEASNQMSETWEEAVLRIVRAKNGEISLREIYEEIEPHPLVTPHHRKLWGGQPKYHHCVRSRLAVLRERGEVEHLGHPRSGRYVSN